ncbi:MAG: dihydroneopterin aldolase [Terrimicrobiaceae bacterium]|jgi:dihydroneopterin aldolase|nr:dihydroneopterin aldolase [Terrimicrobiaceae bacterium]
MNEIWIKGLKVRSLVGVVEDERQQEQELQVDLCICPSSPFAYMNDDIARTIDYDAVARGVRELVGEHPRHLIETLAADVARLLVDEFHAVSVTVEVRKFVLPETDYVAARCRLER